MTAASRVRRALCLILFVATATLAARGAVQDTASPTLAGAVVADDQTAHPVRRALVSMVDSASGIGRTEMTDEQGRFSFSVLPRARFSLTVTKLGFVTTYYGSTRAGQKPAATIELAAGQRNMSVTIKMPRTAAIAGHVRDRRGRPVAGALIEVLETAGPRTAPLLNTARAFSGQPRTVTDLHGEYRFWGLAPGTFVVRFTLAESADGHRVTTPGDIEWALAQLRLGSTLPTAARSTPRPAAANAIPSGTVYYPEALDLPGAWPIVLRAGETRSDIDVVVSIKTVVRD